MGLCDFFASALIITITNSSNIIGGFAAFFFFTNHSVHNTVNGLNPGVACNSVV